MKLLISESCVFWTPWWPSFHSAMPESCLWLSPCLWLSCIFTHLHNSRIPAQLPRLPLGLDTFEMKSWPIPLRGFFFSAVQAGYVLFANNSSKFQWRSQIYVDFIGLSVSSSFCLLPILLSESETLWSYYIYSLGLFCHFFLRITWHLFHHSLFVST